MKESMGPPDNGRFACGDCGSRNTEIVRTWFSGNSHTVECHDCSHEMTKHSGPECPDCGSNNTVMGTAGVAPHRKRGVRCRDCGKTP
jgi:ribosomal protein S27E